MSAYMTPMQAVVAILGAPNSLAAREVLIEYGRQEFHYGEDKGRNDAREEAARASASTPEAAPFLLRDFAPLVDAVESCGYHDGRGEGSENDSSAARLALLSAISSSVAAAREEGRREGIGEARDVAIRWARSGGAGRWSSQAIADDIAALAEKTETKS